MKYHVTPELSSKLGRVRPASLERLAVLISRIGQASEESILEDLSDFSVQSLESGIYVARAGTARVFFAFGEEDGDRYVLLLDVLEYEPKATLSNATLRKGPITDSHLNPNVNSRINPYVNSQLNPFVNSRLNPLVNRQLNPYVNRQLNPLTNPRVNPLVSPTLNPLLNTRLNPLVNRNINPLINRNYRGPYIYDLGLKETGYLVQASEDVVLLFDERGKHTGLGVVNPIQGYTLFDEQNKWVGQLVPDGQGGYLNFDSNSQWKGIVV